jgi:hypothetical protein
MPKEAQSSVGTGRSMADVGARQKKKAARPQPRVDKSVNRLNVLAR